MLRKSFCYSSSGKLENEKLVYPDDIDENMVPLCDLFNLIPGLQTGFSCEGHFNHVESEAPDAYISFLADDIRGLVMLNQVLDKIKHHPSRGTPWEKNAVYIPCWGKGEMTWHEKQCGEDRIRVRIGARFRCQKEKDALFNLTCSVLKDYLSEKNILNLEKELENGKQ